MFLLIRVIRDTGRSWQNRGKLEKRGKLEETGNDSMIEGQVMSLTAQCKKLERGCRRKMHLLN